MSSEARLLDLQAQLDADQHSVTREAWLQVADELLAERDSAIVVSAATVGLRICQRLYQEARSFDAIPVALSVLQRASDLELPLLMQQAANACGLLSSDTADFAGALDFHGRSLELTLERRDQIGSSRAWNNIGSAFCGVGRYELASKSFRHALERIELVDGPQFSRYSALTNLAQCALHLGKIDEGLAHSELALGELHAGLDAHQVDPFSQVILRRNIVRLLVARGDIAEADRQVGIAHDLAQRAEGTRASIAAATAQAVVEIARGRGDIAATRLERCLIAARPIRPALRDTLACMVRADEVMGNPARALVRLQELSDLVHDANKESSKGHIALADWRRSLAAVSQCPDLDETRTRLEKKRGVASIPPSWTTLTRIALGNSLQMDPTAEHGIRVGMLCRLLAQASGIGPVHALEIGLAAQVHDVGIAGYENLVGGHPGSEGGAIANEDAGHCEAGWAILCDDAHPRILLAREIAKYHHAWWDGRGHPRGLAGRSIPLHARICAVGDVYDTIMHGSGSSTGDTIASGLDQLRAMSGTRLDPSLVDTFIDSMASETRSEGIDLDTGHGLRCFHKLIGSLSRTHHYL